tara:strand:- start:469 stop:1020 length:552 start_codon:yes stop_codon:yes gene_type:complete
MKPVIYVDMDGVLADLDGMLASQFGLDEATLLSDRQRRSDLITESIKKNGLQHWLSIPPIHPEKWYQALGLWDVRGSRLEVLTSYGEQNVGDYGSRAHGMKVSWLRSFYDSTFAGFNGVQFCEQKALFARPHTILIDDQPDNVRGFNEAGGIGILYTAATHGAVITRVDQAIARVKQMETQCS